MKQYVITGCLVDRDLSGQETFCFRTIPRIG